MSKIKVKRQGTFIDMTAMCDVAFLLLTFFILTTKFKPNEPVQVDIPASQREIPLPEKDIMIISVDKTGRVFFGIDDQNTRSCLLGSIADKYGFKGQVTEDMEKRFKNIDQFGVPLAQLPQLLKLSPEDIGGYKQPGVIITDSLDNELGDLIYLSRVCNPNLRIAIKGDKQAEYNRINEIVATLQRQEINRFNLITSAKAKAE